MTKGGAILIAVGVVATAALGAVLLAKRAAAPTRASAGGLPPPGPPGAAGMGGRAPNGASGYSKTDLAADALTGGAYSTTKYALENPGKAFSIVSSFL